MALEVKLKKEDPKTILLLWEGVVWRNVSKSLFFNDLSKFPSDLTREGFLEQFSLLEQKVGKRYSLYLLSQRAFLSSELQEKLISKGISANVAKELVQYCVEKGFLDDNQQVSRLVAKELRKGRSSKAVLFKLRAKHVDETLLRDALKEVPCSDADALHKWLAKNERKINRNDPHAMRKVMAKLCRKGFSTELVFNVLGQHSDDN